MWEGLFWRDQCKEIWEQRGGCLNSLTEPSGQQPIHPCIFENDESSNSRHCQLHNQAIFYSLLATRVLQIIKNKIKFWPGIHKRTWFGYLWNCILWKEEDGRHISHALRDDFLKHAKNSTHPRAVFLQQIQQYAFLKASFFFFF